MKQISVSSRSSEPCCQRVFKHIAASSGIFSNHDSCLVILSEIPAQITSYLKCMFYCQYNISFSAEAISPKIFSHNHLPLSLQ